MPLETTQPNPQNSSEIEQFSSETNLNEAEQEYTPRNKKIGLIIGIITIIILGIIGWLVYSQTSLFYPTISKIIFEKENISTEPFSDFLLNTEKLAKEWAPDAKLKWMRFSIPEQGYYESYEIMFVSQSKKIKTDAGMKPAVLDVRYNCEPFLETNKLLKIKGHACKPVFNKKLVALFCHEGTTCSQATFSDFEAITIDNIKLSGMEAYEKTPSKSKMGILVTENNEIYWRFGWGYNVDAVTGEVTIRDENVEKNNLENKEEQDSDNDGLTDIEEAKYGTDPDNPDSDGDGYKDGDEVEHGYNPLINEKVAEQDNKTTIKTDLRVYENQHCNCIFNYPSSWEIEDKMLEGRGWISVLSDEYHPHTTVPMKKVTINNFTNVFDGNKSLIERLNSYFKERDREYEISDYSDNNNVTIKKVKSIFPDGSTKIDLYFDALNGKTMLINKSNEKIIWEEDEEIKNIISSIKLIKN